MSFLPPQFKDKNKTKPGAPAGSPLSASFDRWKLFLRFPLSPTENRRGSSCAECSRLGGCEVHQEPMGRSLSQGHLFAGGVQGLGEQGQGLRHSHQDACLSNTAQASTWQFWELLVSDRFCLKKKHTKKTTKKNQIIAYTGEDVSKGNSHSLLWECKIAQQCWKIWHLLIKLNIHLPYIPVILYLNVYIDFIHNYQLLEINTGHAL